MSTRRAGRRAPARGAGLSRPLAPATLTPMRRRLATLALLVALATPACGDDTGTSGAAASTGDATSAASAASSSSAGTTAASTSASSTGESTTTIDTSTSAAASSTSATSTTDPGTTSTSTSTTGGTSGSGTTAGADGDYYAFALFGGLDRIVIRKANADTGHCTELRLVAPAGLDTLAITTPRGWSVESASIHDTLDGCLAQMPVAGAVEWALTGQGEVTWTLPPMQIYPCALTLDVTLDLPPMTWAPLVDALVAVDLEVVGAC